MDEKLDRYIIGLEYTYSKMLRFSVAYDRTNVDNLGDALGVTKETDKYGVYSQFLF